MAVQFQFRVLYADTDAMEQAYYANYLKWFEIGRSEFFRSCGKTYRELESEGVFLPVIEAHCKYTKPAFYDDLLVISTTFCFEGPARLRFNYELHRNPSGELLADGYTVHVCKDSERKVIRPPESLKALIESIGRND
jgi:acyl-CoA thioester hydrolase